MERLTACVGRVMNCKECLHYEACATWAEGFSFGKDDEVCQLFSEKSAWIKLPFRPYEKASIIRNGGVEVCTVDGIHLTARGDYIRLRPLIQSYLGNLSVYYKPRLSSFGKTVFRSSEEANEVLKQSRRDREQRGEGHG